MSPISEELRSFYWSSLGGKRVDFRSQLGPSETCIFIMFICSWMNVCGVRSESHETINAHTGCDTAQSCVHLFTFSQLLIDLCFDFSHLLTHTEGAALQPATRSWAWLTIWAHFWWCHLSFLVWVKIRGDPDWMSCRQVARFKSNTSWMMKTWKHRRAAQCWWRYWSVWGSNTDLN